METNSIEKFIYTMDHRVIYSDTDARGLLSLPSLFSLFQEGALLQAEELGFGESYCKKEGLMWVLSRVDLEIVDLPFHRDLVSLKTWPKKPQGPFANRDFLLFSADGQILARTTSAWLLLQAESLRPVRPASLFEIYPFEELGAALPESASKISMKEGEPEKELQVTARYSDLDQNMHVNNTRYVRWFLDCFSPEEIRARGNVRFSINYVKAAAIGDQVKLQRFHGDGEFIIRGVMEDGSNSFLAKIRVID